jgi:lipoprotein-releasing system permease protein
LLSPSIDSLGSRDLVLGKSLAESMNLTVGDPVSVLLSPSYTDTSASSSGVAQRFRVASVLHSGTELDRQLALGAQSTIAALSPSVRQNGLSVQIRDVLQAPGLRFQLSQSLPIGLWVSDWTATQGNLYRAIQLSRQIVVLLLMSLIAIAVFNIVTSLILVVTDRRPAIAILRTMGLQKADVTLVFMLQGGVIGAIGGLLGSALGFLLALSAPQLSALLEWLSGQPLLNTQVYPLDFVPVDIRWSDFVIVPGIAFTLALLASSIPARQAAAASISDALSQSR